MKHRVIIEYYNDAYYNKSNRQNRHTYHIGRRGFLNFLKQHLGDYIEIGD
ncbi:MAG: hypothetical protein LBV52_02695 [Spirochaetaceae bacterium]|nr:hypothetical protein [Spirochaetaceae bacterium]